MSGVVIITGIFILIVILIPYIIDAAYNSEPDLIIKDDGVYYDIDEKRKYV